MLKPGKKGVWSAYRIKESFADCRHQEVVIEEDKEVLLTQRQARELEQIIYSKMMEDQLRMIDQETKDACEVVHYAIMHRTPVSARLVSTLAPDMELR